MVAEEELQILVRSIGWMEGCLAITWTDCEPGDKAGVVDRCAQRNEGKERG